MAPRVPFIGRLYLTEYLALTLSFVLLSVETLLRSITLLLPSFLIRFCYRASRNAFNSLSSPYSRRARNKKKGVSSPIAQAQDFVELCELYGYYAEEHIVQTKDGYLLGLHRLGWRKGEEEQRVNAGPGSIEKKVAYLHHGLLMNSEVWVCITEKERCLPFTLVDQGYDVWLGNNRGNKYSKKCLHHAPTQIEFWNFSMDQFAFHDIPDSINYILDTTHQPSLSYIGFSQGSAQAFATLSINPTLNAKVNVFVALAPAMAPPGLASGIVASLCKSNPSILFLAFGHRAILGSTTMWQALLYPAIFGWFIDKSLSFLFGWQTRNITPHQKLAAYPHLYSFTSTKSVVHWFQIIRNGTFQMYDDEVSTPLAVGNGSKYYKVAKFPTRNIKTPIVLIYGGSDSLVDINLMLKELPKHTVAKGVQKYEHLDLLWASDVDTLVHPHVLEALERYGVQPPHSTQAALGWRSVSQTRGVVDRATMVNSPDGSLGLPGGYSDSEQTVRRSDQLRGSYAPHRRRGEAPFQFSGYDGNGAGDERPSTAEEGQQLDESDEEEDEGAERFALTPNHQPFGESLPSAGPPALPLRRLEQQQATARPSTPSSQGSKTVTSPTKRRVLSPRLRSPKIQQQRASQNLSEDGPLSSPLNSGFTDTSHRTRPEGWWSSASSTAESSRSASRTRIGGHDGGHDGVQDGAHDGAAENGGVRSVPALPARSQSRPASLALTDYGPPLTATAASPSSPSFLKKRVRAAAGEASPSNTTPRLDNSPSPVSVVRRQLGDEVAANGKVGSHSRNGSNGSRNGEVRRGSDASSISEQGIGLVKGKAEAVMGRARGVDAVVALAGGAHGSSGGNGNGNGGGKKRARQE